MGAYRSSDHLFYPSNNNSLRPKKDSEVWKPFGVNDSFLIEAAYEEGNEEIRNAKETEPIFSYSFLSCSLPIRKPAIYNR